MTIEPAGRAGVVVPTCSAVVSILAQVDGLALRATLDWKQLRSWQKPWSKSKSLEVDSGRRHWSREDDVAIPKAWKVFAVDHPRFIWRLSGRALGVGLVHTIYQSSDVFGLPGNLNWWRRTELGLVGGLGSNVGTDVLLAQDDAALLLDDKLLDHAALAGGWHGENFSFNPFFFLAHS